MAEETPDRAKSSSSSKSGKSAKSAPTFGGPTDDGIAPVQGDYTDDRPPEEKPGDPAHLGGDRPYEGETLEVNPL